MVKDSIFPENADCINAIKVNKSVFGPTNPPIGHGDILEFEGNTLDDPYFIEREHHTVWYYFTMPADGILTFEIIPETVEDDYDFMLFRYTDENFCNEVKTQSILAVRSNISRNNPQVNSRTGLSENAGKKHVPAGPGDDFSKALEVKKAEKFYLLVDNVYENGKGHTLKINFPVPRNILTISVTDKYSKKNLDAKIEISDYHSQKKYYASNISSKEKTQSFELAVQKSYLLSCNSEGYFFVSKEVLFDEQSVHVNCELSPIREGYRVSLNNIHFTTNDTTLMPHSHQELRQLLNFMKMYPGLHIEIHGHVNGPFMPNVPFYMELSNNRARAIRNYLAHYNIDKSRMSWKGFGNTRMLYPEAIREAEMRYNRRVEIKVTKK